MILLNVLSGIAGNTLSDIRTSLINLFQNDDPPITKAMLEALREPAPVTHDSVTATVHRAQEATHKK